MTDEQLRSAVSAAQAQAGKYVKTADTAIDLASVDPNTGVAAMQDADTAYIALPRRFTYSYGPGDRTPVRVVACDLPLGSCSTVVRLRDLSRLVLGPGPEFL